MTIYQLLGPKSIALPEELTTRHQLYAQALDLYRGENYSAAGMLWQKNPHDSPSQHMMRRCKDILEGKVSVEQGVFAMTHK